MQFIYDDGGRAAAGFKGKAGDCVARAIAIATERPYKEVYMALAQGNMTQRSSKWDRGFNGHMTAGHGINVRRKWFKEYMTSIGWKWTPTMFVGVGCKVHLLDYEVPMQGRIIVAIAKHYTTVIDGVIHDLFDPQRHPFDERGARCVYGYWSKA